MSGFFGNEAFMRTAAVACVQGRDTAERAAVAFQEIRADSSLVTDCWTHRCASFSLPPGVPPGARSAAGWRWGARGRLIEVGRAVLSLPAITPLPRGDEDRDRA